MIISFITTYVVFVITIPSCNLVVLDWKDYYYFSKWAPWFKHENHHIVVYELTIALQSDWCEFSIWWASSSPTGCHKLGDPGVPVNHVPRHTAIPLSTYYKTLKVFLPWNHSAMSHAFLNTFLLSCHMFWLSNHPRACTVWEQGVLIFFFFEAI